MTNGGPTFPLPSPREPRRPRVIHPGSTILVTGGAGYVGTQTVWHLHDAGYRPVVYDDLSTGHPHQLPPDVPRVVGDIRDPFALRQALLRYRPRGIIHCAAKSLVGESGTASSLYWGVNVGGTASLAQIAGELGVQAIVFSSSAAVYGEPHEVPITENHPLAPINVYGHTKAVCERVLFDAAQAGGAPAMALRYFNAAGADPQGRCGEDHHPETHLLPNLIRALLHQGPPLTVFGNDWPTPDGSAIRDYIHTLDIAQAHLLALHHLWSGGDGGALNIGTGRGVSLRNWLDLAERRTGLPVPHTLGPRRTGDPAILVAHPDLARRVLGFTTSFSDPETLFATAKRWHSRKPLSMSE